MSFQPERLPILRADRGARSVSHWILNQLSWSLEDTGIPDRSPSVCYTTLPAIMCVCRRWFIEQR